MNVEDVIAEKIAAARRKIEADKRSRAEFIARRNAGVAKRHAAKLHHLASQEDPVKHRPKILIDVPTDADDLPAARALFASITHCSECGGRAHMLDADRLQMDHDSGCAVLRAAIRGAAGPS